MNIKRHIIFIYINALLYISFFTFASEFIETKEVVATKKPWTFLIYMAADNSLQPDADINIEQLKKIGSNENVTILVHLNTKRPGQPKITQKLIINKGSVTQIGQTQSLDSGSVDTLIDALDWAMTYFPATHYGVDLWDHGSGPLNRKVAACRGCCYDDSTGHYLTDRDLQKAFDYAVNGPLNHKKIDIIAFDACLMADLEIAFTLQPYAHFLLSSQETIPGLGFDYQNSFALFQTAVPNASQLGKTFIKTYEEQYTQMDQPFTLSLINLDHLDPLVATHKKISQLLSAAIEKSGQNMTNAITNAIAQTLSFTEPTYFDLASFYANLIKGIEQNGSLQNAHADLINALNTGINFIKRIIPSQAHSKEYNTAHGISIYFPQGAIEPSYEKLFWSENNPWLAFLEMYIAHA